jgi:plasmid stabilization system protein ParE
MAHRGGVRRRCQVRPRQMNKRYHRRVAEDFAAVLDYYEREAGATVAEEFQAELMAVIDKVAVDPRRFPPCGPRLRRANLDRFPYHFLFEVRSGYIYVTVLRHDKRRPSFGLRRR